MDYRELISGTDIRGTAIGSSATLTARTAEAFAYAFATFLREKGKEGRLKIAVGHDSRLSAEALFEGIKNGLTPLDIEIYSCGLASTPAMFMMTKFEETDCDGAIMITASHHPSDKNGLKFFTKDGGLEKEDIERLASLAEVYNFEKKPQNYKLVKKDFLSLYCNALKDFITKGVGCGMPLEGIKAVVDAGNGAGGFYVNSILRPLGASTYGSKFLNPDGNFPNHTPNPEDKIAMSFITNAVRESGADIGIIFDTDVDRAAVVDSSGNEYNRNKLIALVSSIILEETPNATIVTDSITSDALTEFIEKKGGKHHRFKRGYKNVINEAIRLNKEGIYTPVAIETSGHCALKENYFLDDGAYLAARLLIKLAELKRENKTLESLIEGLKDAEESAEFRITFNVSDFTSYGNSVFERLLNSPPKGFLQATSYEGVRFNFEGGWILLRMSVHDPNMPVNIEGNKGTITPALNSLYNSLKEFAGLELGTLKKLL